MSGWIPARFRGTLLGNDLSQVDANRLENLIGIPEGPELEFKEQMYTATAGGRKEFANDITQFANSTGGIIIVGIEEDGAGNATKIAPVRFPTEPGVWMNQVIASTVFPRLAISTHLIGSGDEGVLIVSVPRSPHPHAISGDSGSLRYPVRAGSQRSWMSEAEVSDRYGRRFRNVLTVESRLDELQLTALDLVQAVGKAGLKQTYLIMCAVPEQSGILELHRDLSTQYSIMLQQELTHFPLTDDFGFKVEPGFRSLQVGRAGNGDGGRLNLDGSGFLVLSSFVEGHDTIGEDAQNITFGIDDSFLLSDLINGIRALAMHAAMSGALGTLNMSVQIAAPRASFITLTKSDDRFPIRRPLDNASPVEPPSPATRRTFGIDAVTTDPLSLVSAARLISSDLLSAFGLAEPRQIAIDGSLLRQGFARAAHKDVSSWAEQYGIDLR